MCPVEHGLVATLREVWRPSLSDVSAMKRRSSISCERITSACSLKAFDQRIQTSSLATLPIRFTLLTITVWRANKGLKV